MSEIPGLRQASIVQNKINNLGIPDVELFFDPQIKIWAVCQVYKRTGRIIIPDNYMQDGVRPHIMWYIKDNQGHFRLPSDQDVADIVVTLKRSEISFKKGGDWMADEFDKQSAEKDRKHQEKFRERIHAIAPAMKKAIKSGDM